jgi:hypothetical protein
MRRFVLVMRRLQKSHVAFSFSHAAFPYLSWSISILPPPNPKSPKAPPKPMSSALQTKSNPSPAPPTMTEARDLAAKIFGTYLERPVFELFRKDF